MSRDIIVNLWKTDLHSVEMGFKKQKLHKAKSRQYTADSDIFGEFEGATNGYVVLRQDPWNCGPEEQRLVIKSFTDSINWKGTLEEMVGLGMSRSLASGESLPCFTINLSNHDHLIMLERVFKPKTLKRKIYSFLIVEDEKMEAYRITSDRLTLGSDWDVFNQHGDKVAVIDGSKFNLGGKWAIRFDENYKVHAVVDDILLLFCAFLRYESEVRERIDKNVEKYNEDGNEFAIKISTDEAFLYDNPRRMKY